MTDTLTASPPKPAPDDAKTYFVPAGKVIVVHSRWSYANGAEDCVGLFRAVKDYRPVDEHAEYIRQNPDAEPDPVKWDAKARNAFLKWEIEVRKTLEDVNPFYLFLEPFPEAPTQGIAPE